MEQQALNQLMRDSANDAITTSQEEFNVQLDYSVDSVAQVDQIILQFLENYKEQALEDKAVFTICNIYGAYIGETFRKLAGGQWQYNIENEDAPTIMLIFNDKSFAFAGICYERLVNNSKISVKRYFDEALGQLTQ
ncbi:MULTISPECIES: hypothetical protein [Alteromonadaceae]|jgi:hypothetical protein|uniref:DUF3806 domain-containing protein n=1 Tax=Brumicola blandensis TaxID=3075611 RepID=A0AAW8R1L9_9ALTE|nr:MULTISPECIES: hypothetical protein [unclassified Alteromonas]MDT0581745.1 hypothetical protein [Alteromonas sp. W409]MDT0629795.1 hypothetical protein [Alteromonas sp. W364]